jgi:hypothetical membrane protein
MMKNHNIYISLGLLLNSIYLFLNNFSSVPGFFMGLLFGSGIFLFIIGVYSKNHDLSKFKNFKHNLFNKVFGQ